MSDVRIARGEGCTVRELRTCDPFVRFVIEAGGERVAVWARTREHAERFVTDRAAVEASDAAELADKLAAAKSAAQEVLEAWPDEAYGFAGTLEQAVALMGECVDELDRVGEDS